MTAPRFICTLAELPDPGSRGFARDQADGFVVHKNGRVYGYLDRCPHTGVPLEWVPHQFLDFDGDFIQCATHGALFRIEDGLCLRGPCVGQSLEPLALQVTQGRVELTEIPQKTQPG